MNIEKIVGHFGYGQPQLANSNTVRVLQESSKAKSNLPDAPGTKTGAADQPALKSNRHGETHERAKLQQRVADTAQASQAAIQRISEENKTTSKVMMAAISYPIKNSPNQYQMLGTFIDRSA